MIYSYTIEIIINSDQEIGGFQFTLSGVSLNNEVCSGGLSNENGFNVSTGPKGVIGFSLTGSTIPPTNGQEEILTIVPYSNPDGSSICLPNSNDELIMSSNTGSGLDGYIIHYQNICQ